LPWGESKLALFVNPNNSSKPKMIIYDINEEDQKKSYETLDLNNKESIIGRIYLCNYDKDVVMFENF